MNVFWFKRDLRLEDNEALALACKYSKPLLLLYILEPSLLLDAHTSERHINFIKESLLDLNNQLIPFGSKILLIQDEVKISFENLFLHYEIEEVFSTEEVGINLTYERDLEMKSWFESANIKWTEKQYNGVKRGIKNRQGWSNAWRKYMTSPQALPDLQNATLISTEQVNDLQQNFEIINCSVPIHNFQKGGRTEGLKWATSFFNKRIQDYSKGISKPELSRKTCSRLSPYFAWGNISIREIYQEAISSKAKSDSKRPFYAYLARLRWQSHFIQKFEMEPRMEFEAINRAYLNLDQQKNEVFIAAWKSGKTGYPLVDASVRALKETGYINFRMRSMITSFYVHHLFQHFKSMSDWLARQFLDFEPGIHYGQLQMQSGFTGTNTIRIYNPTKNALDHDADAVFIKKWVKELSNLPSNLAIEPWNLTSIEEKLYDFKVGVSYPERIVDISETRKNALQKLYGMRKSDYFKSEKQRILDTHTIKRNYN